MLVNTQGINFMNKLFMTQKWTVV